MYKQMRLSLSIILLLIFNEQAFSQKKLAVYKTFGSVVYELDSTTISPKQVSIILRQYPEAYKEFKIAKSTSTISSVIGFASGVLVAIPLVTAVAGGQPEWIFAGAGGALFLVTIPLTSSFRNHAFNAIESYNSKLPTANNRIRPSIHFTGIGGSILVRF